MERYNITEHITQQNRATMAIHATYPCTHITQQHFTLFTQTLLLVFIISLPSNFKRHCSTLRIKRTLNVILCQQPRKSIAAAVLGSTNVLYGDYVEFL